MTRAASAACVIVHYHEISLKRGNRPLFLHYLKQNLLRATSDLGPIQAVQLPGRIRLDLAPGADLELIRDRVGRVAGVANLALAERIPATIDAMKGAVERAIADRAF